MISLNKTTSEDESLLKRAYFKWKQFWSRAVLFYFLIMRKKVNNYYYHLREEIIETRGKIT